MRHHVEQNAAGLARVVDGHDMRVCEARSGLDLLEESLGAEGGGDFGVQDLHRDAAAVPRVERAVNGRHPAAPDLELDGIAVAECGLGG